MAGTSATVRFSEEKKESNLLPELYESPALPTCSSPHNWWGRIESNDLSKGKSFTGSTNSHIKASPMRFYTNQATFPFPQAQTYQAYAVLLFPS